MYAKIGILDLRCWNMEKNTSWINKKIDYIFEIWKKSPLISCPCFSLILTGRSPKEPVAKASKTVP